MLNLIELSQPIHKILWGKVSYKMAATTAAAAAHVRHHLEFDPKSNITPNVFSTC